MRPSPQAYNGVIKEFMNARPQDQLSAVRQGYDRWSRVYDRDANPLPALEEPHMRNAIGNVQGAAVLDLGCGTGRHGLWLAAAGASVTAVDFSEGMLAEARLKPGADKIRFLIHDLHEQFPFSDGVFDVVISGLVLEHIGNHISGQLFSCLIISKRCSIRSMSFAGST